MAAWGRSLVFFAVLSVGCGRASKDASAPGQPGSADETLSEQAPPPPAAPAPVATPAEEAPSSTKDEERRLPIDEAVSEFERARRELSQLLGRDLELAEARESAAPSGGAAAPERDAPRSRPPASASDKATNRAEGEDSKARAVKKGDDGCVNVCRAFESLTRSAAAVCRLDQGERCRSANAVVAVAQADTGVKACACKK